LLYKIINIFFEQKYFIMNQKKRQKISFASFSFVLVLATLSCGISNKEVKTAQDTIQEVKLTVGVDDEKTIVYTKYNLPLPIELYRYLKEQDVVFNQDLIHNPKLANKYNTSISKAFNLGLYSSDLAYLTIFQENQLIIEFFATTKKLAEELNIAEGYDKVIMQRLQTNLNNNDSLKKIASDSYWKACRYLEQNNNINVLPFMVVAGWVESMYLILNASEGKFPKVTIIELIGSQKESLTNLVNYLFEVMADSNAFYLNVDIQKLIKKLNELKENFDKIQDRSNSSLVEFNYKEMKTKISKIREFYINM